MKKLQGRGDGDNFPAIGAPCAPPAPIAQPWPQPLSSAQNEFFDQCEHHVELSQIAVSSLRGQKLGEDKIDLFRH
nr:hypothetical protein [Allorhizocola rhizosphaerae]